MGWYGGGFIPIIIYGGFTESVLTPFELITQSNDDILTQDSKMIIVQTP